MLGNVTTRAQVLPFDANADVVPVGGSNSLQFLYDPLNQLTHADLNIKESSFSQQRASFDVAYDQIGNITSKVQTDLTDTLNAQGQVIGTTVGQNQYSGTPTYASYPKNPFSKHAPTSIAEVYQNTNNTTRTISYDYDGNMTSFVYPSGQGRFYTWTDTDRIKAVCDGTSPTSCTLGYIQSPLYDANGVRTNNKVTKNGVTNETLYVNQFLTIRNGSYPTKHVYLGDARVASKIDLSSGASQTFWYHSDHLQSTQYVTTTGASAPSALAQHLEYYPSGAIWREEDDTSKLLIAQAPHGTAFSGKEMDATGSYYFGARYYDPTMQIWLSPDPMLGQYMGGSPQGGVFTPGHLGLYTYVLNNPVVLRDPSGLVEQFDQRDMAALANDLRATARAEGRTGGPETRAEKAMQLLSGGLGLGLLLALPGGAYLLGALGFKESVDHTQNYLDSGGKDVGELVQGAGAFGLCGMASPEALPGALSSGTGPRFEVTEGGIAIPRDAAELKSNMSRLVDKTTDAAKHRKFVGADSEGPVRVRIEKAHPADPNFTGTPNPLHAVDHMHIERRANGQTGDWGPKETVPRAWPF
jgi:RHS repeat-associated protein